MGTPLSTNDGTRFPSLKLRNIGDYADVAIVDITKVPRRDYTTGEQKKDQRGNLQTQDRVVVIVGGGKAVINENEVDRPAEAGEVAVIYFAGRDRWDKDLDATRTGDVGRSFSTACELLDGGLQVGDVMRWSFDDEVPGKGSQPRKIRTVRLRHPRVEEAAQAQRCEDLRLELQQQTRTSLAPAGAPANDEYYPDEDPF